MEQSLLFPMKAKEANVPNMTMTTRTETNECLFSLVALLLIGHTKMGIRPLRVLPPERRA